MIKALLFDFDGLLVNTEVAGYTAWKEIFTEHGQELTVQTWSVALGTISPVDWTLHLEKLTGQSLDRLKLDARRHARRDQLLAKEHFREGVVEFLEMAKRKHYRIAIVSSANQDWIDSHLQRLDPKHDWDLIVCANFDASIAKPAPFLYQKAMKLLKVKPNEAIAFEDSPNGIKAAKAAGLFCVVVSNELTRQLDLTLGDLHVKSFKQLELKQLIKKVESEPR